MKKLFPAIVGLSIAVVLTSTSFPIVAEEQPGIKTLIPLTSGPGHHFFGYFGVPPWDERDERFLVHETAFDDHMPSPEEVATIGYVDLKTGGFVPLAETRAWNFQQGAMTRWLPGPEPLTEPRIIYNDRKDNKAVSVILNVETGARRVLPRPISAVSRDGKTALSFSYARLGRFRPVTGYPGLEEPSVDKKQPEDDGLYTIDIETGETALILSLAEICKQYKGKMKLKRRDVWASHTAFNTDGSRFAFLLRYYPLPAVFDTAMLTANVDGSDLRLAVDFGKNVSHYTWLSPTEILATMDLRKDLKGDEYVMFTDGERNYKIVGEGLLTRDGHPSVSPDGRWLLTDTYADPEKKQSLILYNLGTGEKIVLGRFFTPHKFSDIRCDLHPRWSRDGRQVAFDSVHEGHRQVYVIDVSSVVHLYNP